MEKDAKIYIAGHRGLVGAAIHRQLRVLGYKNLISPVLGKKKVSFCDYRYCCEEGNSEGFKASLHFHGLKIPKSLVLSTALHVMTHNTIVIDEKYIFL